MLIQIAFLQRFSVYLGHPTYTFSIILFLMILSAGLGSFASEAIDLTGRGVVWLPLGIAVAVLVETLLLQPIVELTVGWAAARPHPGRRALRRAAGVRAGLLFSDWAAARRPAFRSADAPGCGA